MITFFKKMGLALSLTAILFTGTTCLAAKEPVQVFTSFFPTVVIDNPEKPGAAYELVQALFTEIGEEIEIIPLPWARAQHLAKNTPHSLIFPYSRTPTREKDFVWKVNILNNQTHFITYKNPKLTPETARDKTIGVQAKSSWDNWLIEQGYQNIYHVTGAGEELIRLLRNNRIDAWYVDQIIADGVIKALRDPNFTYSDPVQVFYTFLSTNSKTPYPHMDKLQVALEKLKKSGKVKEIFDRYNISPNYR